MIIGRLPPPSQIRNIRAAASAEPYMTTTVQRTALASALPLAAALQCEIFIFLSLSDGASGVLAYQGREKRAEVEPSIRKLDKARSVRRLSILSRS